MGAVYTQLSLRERRRIENWWHAKVPVREMARVLRRSKAPIHREIKRNFWADETLPRKYAGYFGSAAHAIPPRRGRKAPSRIPTAAPEDGCPASATSRHSLIMI